MSALVERLLTQSQDGDHHHGGGGALKLGSMHASDIAGYLK